jgi:hypothetical protein
VVPSNVSYPTDSGLLAKAVRRIGATAERIQAAGGATRTTVRDRSRAAGKRAHAIGAKLRWWPSIDQVVFDGERVPVWHRESGQYVDPDTGEVLPTWEQALELAGCADVDFRARTPVLHAGRGRQAFQPEQCWALPAGQGCENNRAWVRATWPVTIRTAGRARTAVRNPAPRRPSCSLVAASSALPVRWLV